MLYAHNISGEQLVTIPLLYGGELLPYRLGPLKLRGTVSLKEYEVPVEEESRTILNVSARVDLSGVPAGEYEYVLAGVSSGLMMVLDHEGVKQYAKSITYKQYGKTNE